MTTKTEEPLSRLLRRQLIDLNGLYDEARVADDHGRMEKLAKLIMTLVKQISGLEEAEKETLRRDELRQLFKSFGDVVAAVVRDEVKDDETACRIIRRYSTEITKLQERNDD